MNNSFFALIGRMRYIGRWGLMRTTISENIQEHSHMVAVLAHALAVIRRDIFGKPCDPNACAAEALFHDASEILTGDLPTPIKYNNPGIIGAYKAIEREAGEQLLRALPEELIPAYRSVLTPEKEHELVKAADKLSAYIQCVEERKAGNVEFATAEKQTLQALHTMEIPELEYFLEHFMPSFELTLDEQQLSLAPRDSENQ